MKILIIRNSPDKVDFENVTYNRQETGLAKAFNRLGHQCDLVYYGGKTDSEIKMEYESGKTFTIYLKSGRELMKNAIYHDLDELIDKYDVVQSGGYDQIQSWRLAQKYSNKLTIYNGTYYSDFNKGYNKKCKIIDALFVPRYKKKNTYFVTKNILSEEFLRNKGIRNVYSIGVGIDTDQLAENQLYSSDLSEKIERIKKDNKVLLYIGRVEPRRNIAFLFKCFAEVKKRVPNVKLVIVGRGNSDYVKSVFDLAKELKIDNDIVRVERLEQKYLARIYKSCDLFLLPTLYEIFGMVLLEAMYFGIPVVTSLNGGSDVLIKGRGTGCIVEAFDVDDWCESIINLLNDDISRDRIGKKAANLIRQEFTWEALAKKFLNVYSELLDNQSEN